MYEENNFYFIYCIICNMLYEVVIHFVVYDLPVQYLFHVYFVIGYIYIGAHII